MNHDEAVLLLADRHHDRLDGAVAADLAVHLAVCGECASLSRTYADLAAALRPDPPASNGIDHPASARLVAYAMGSRELDETDLASVAAHLRSCRDCLREVDATRKAERSFRRSIRPWILRRPGLAAALAAGVAFVTLGYPVFLGIHSLPRSRDEVEHLRQDRQRMTAEYETRTQDLIARYEARLKEPTPPVDPIELHFLVGTGRDDRPDVLVSIEPDQESVHLAVAPEAASIRRGDEPYRFEIAAGGRVVWSAEISGSRILSFLGSPQGAVVFAVPAAVLRAGECTLRLSRATSSGAVLFSQRFRVVR